VGCRPVPRWPSRLPTAGADWSSCSRGSSSNHTWSTPPAARRSPRPGCRNDKVDAQTWRTCCAPTCCRRRGPGPQPVGDLRALLRHRVSLVRSSTASKNRVHAVLADRGVHQPASLWTTAGRAWLATLELPPVPRQIVEDCCGLIDTLATPIARLEREVNKLAKPDPRVAALMALPGVGRLTAMTLLAEIGDSSRFPSARKLCAWAGLTPAVRNLRPQGPPRPHHQAGLGVGALDPPGKPPNEPRPSRRSPAPTPRSPTAAAPRSPPSRSPAGCWPAAFTSSPSWRSRPPRRPPPGALALPHEPATRPLS